jgi:hypothetical protein
MNDRIKKFGASLPVAALILFGAAPGRADLPAATPASSTAAVSPGPAISGFRNAAFGMTQAQVKTVIEKTFKLPASAINAAENALQHTQVLSVQVPDLVPGGGTAAVSYVFGYQTHKLIEINIVWSAQIDPKITASVLYQNGESLQQYFAAEGFPPERSTGNVATPNGILLFRATDTSGNAVLLILSGAMSKDAKTDKSVLSPQALTLAYAADPLHPDVFQLAKGSF